MADAPISSEESGGRVAVFDPFAGISGDMVLGAWVDLGLDPAWLDEVADALGLPDLDIRVERVRRAGVTATRVTIVPPGNADEGHGRTYREIRDRIGSSDLGERTRELSLGAFGRLARAEARVHGVEPEEVHFHEVGAVDALLDVCGACEGYVRLGVARSATLPVTMGRGTVRMQHGEYPLPAPATAYLLEGTATRSPGYEGECVTPTGAALLAELTGGRAFAGDLVPERIGYGAGDRDPADRPNCLRVWLGHTGPADRAALMMLQADVDDMSPEYLPELIDACLDAGALDAVVRWVQMKKGRPGWRVEALVEPGRQVDVETVLFRHSTTLGVRSWPVGRRTLPRWTEEREWRGHSIRVKFARRPGGEDASTVRGKPEHDDVARAAAAEDLSASELLRELRRSWPDLD